MVLKLRFSSLNLICIALVQLIIIDLLLIALFVNRIQSRSDTAADSNQNSRSISISKVSGITNKNVNTEFLRQKYLPERILLSGLFERIKANGTYAGGNKDKKQISMSKGGKNVSPNGLIYDPLKELLENIGSTEIPSIIFSCSDLRNFVEKTFTATAYDLSYASCGKYPSNPAYGITFSGNRAIKGRTIAVDPEVIPLGSRVFIEFPKPYTHFDGWYVAEDTGSKVKGDIIDIFLGESAFYEMEKFGSRKIKVKIYSLVDKASDGH